MANLENRILATSDRFNWTKADTIRDLNALKSAIDRAIQDVEEDRVLPPSTLVRSALSAQEMLNRLEATGRELALLRSLA